MKEDYRNSYDKLADKCRKHLEHIIHSSKDEAELKFRLAGYHGTLLKVLESDNE
jgi:hypothetical protein